MKSTKTSGNLRDFRIDERLASHDPYSQTNEPAEGPVKQWIKPRQEASLQEWSVTSSTTGIVESTDSMDSLWSSWESEADGGVDLAKPVSAPLSAPAKRLSVNAAGGVVASPERQSATPGNANPSLQGQARSETASGPMPWASELAFEERRMERTGTVDYTNQYQKQEILRGRTREFTALLQKLFREHVELFNDARRSPAHQIHVYKVSKTDEDFMLYRNHVKLVVSGQRAGRVIFAFNQYMGQIFAPTQAPVVEIEASWGPFDQLFWSYKGERVQVLDLVRYFSTEFVRQSFR